MKKNVGSADKIARVTLGLIILGAGLYAQSWWGLIGLLPLATAFMGVCPAYSIFGVKTCKPNTDQSKAA